MLANSFGCREHPFGPGFDSRYYFVRPGQEETFRELLARINARDGLVLITGQTGTGKTALLHELIQELQAVDVLPILFPSPAPTSDVLLDSCLEKIGLHHELGAERSRKLEALADSSQRPGPERMAVLLVDEGHALTDDVLSTLLKLSAPDAQGRTGLAIIVAGEPTLEDRLSEELFRPLASSVRYNYRLSPLDKEEVAFFIEHRLRAASCATTNLFSPGAIERVAYYSDGIPARINRLGDVALFIATLESKQQITEDVVEQAACDALLTDEPLDPSPFPASYKPSPQPYESLSQKVQIPVLTDVANAAVQAGPSVANERYITAADSPSAFAYAGPETPEQMAPPWPSRETSPPDPDAPLDLTLEDSGSEVAPTTARDNTEPVDPYHSQPETAGGTVPTEPREDAPRSRWVRHTVVAFGLAAIVITAGWLWSSYELRFQQLQPLLSKLDSVVQLTGSRIQGAISDLRSAAAPGVEPIPIPGTDTIGDSSRPGPSPERPDPLLVGHSSMPVTAPDPPGAASPASPVAELERPPSTPELPMATPGPAPPTSSTADALASWSATCRLLTPAKLRERPAVYSRLVDILRQDTDVLVTGRVPGSQWYRLQAQGGQEGFVYGGLVPKPRSDGAGEENSPSPTLGLLQLDEADAASTEIAQLLALAGEHVRADRLMAPRFDNALAVYRKILRADPNNESALAGIETIKAKLMGFARDATARGDMQTARRQVEKVLLIDAEDMAARTALAKFGEAVPLTDFAGLEERASAK